MLRATPAEGHVSRGQRHVEGNVMPKATHAEGNAMPRATPCSLRAAPLRCRLVSQRRRALLSPFLWPARKQPLTAALRSGVAWPARQWEREEDEVLVVLGSLTNQLVGDQPTYFPSSGVGWSDQSTRKSWLVRSFRTYPAYTGLMAPLLLGSWETLGLTLPTRALWCRFSLRCPPAPGKGQPRHPAAAGISRHSSRVPARPREVGGSLLSGCLLMGPPGGGLTPLDGLC